MESSCKIFSNRQSSYFEQQRSKTYAAPSSNFVARALELKAKSKFYLAAEVEAELQRAHTSASDNRRRSCSVSVEADPDGDTETSGRAVSAVVSLPQADQKKSSTDQ